MTLFNGHQYAQERLALVKQQVTKLAEQGQNFKIASILYTEDAGSRLYTQLKREAAEAVGIEYQVSEFSMGQGVELVLAQLRQLNQDPSVTGIIIQKPWRKTWVEANRVGEGNPKAIRQAFNTWWRLQTSQIALEKDVDGLHPETLAAIKDGTWREQGRVMPATAQAVLYILAEARVEDPAKVVILGRSDILGQPLLYELGNRGYQVEMIGSKELRQRVVDGQGLRDAQVVISATGQHHLITGELLADGVTVVDVGEPRGDVDFESVQAKAAFITPVPGGVGPVTIACLLENCVRLVTFD